MAVLLPLPEWASSVVIFAAGILFGLTLKADRFREWLRK